jgi:TRAP-type C4-dicarboxylate transport system permease large subunit
MLFAGISGTQSPTSRVWPDLTEADASRISVTYSAALTSATSIIGPIIPPSVAMIVYALAVGNVSVGAMFAGGAVPGFLFGGGFLVMAWFTTRRGKYGIVQAWPSAADFFRQTLRVLPLLVLPLIIVGGIFSGVFTVTESAAVGVAYTVLVGFLSKPRLRLRTSTTQRCTALDQLRRRHAARRGRHRLLYPDLQPRDAEPRGSAVSLAVSPTVFMLIGSILLVLGMLMDAVPIMTALAPLLAPIARQFGISDIQFAWCSS